MSTRIRHFRKLRGLTQQQLASLLGTTAATVSRLETADMTISTNWLARMAEVLHVGVSDLLDVPHPDGLACEGEVHRNGLVLPHRGATYLPVRPSSAMLAPHAYVVAEDMGPYSAGDILLTDRFSTEGAMKSAIGLDCFSGGQNIPIRFGRLVMTTDESCLMVPPEAGAIAFEIRKPEWIAPVTMLLRSFPTMNAQPGKTS